MTPTKKRVLIALAIVVLLSTAGWLWWAYNTYRVFATYGESPKLGVLRANDPRDRELVCLQILDVHPKAHFDIFGRMWQDEHIYWEDVELLAPSPTVYDHGRTGPITAPDELCDPQRRWPQRGAYVFYWRPDASLLKRT